MAASTTKEEEVYSHINLSSDSKEQKDDFEPIFRDENEVIELGTYLYLNRFNEVSLTSQTFRAAFNVEFQWKATSNEHTKYINDPKSYIPSWTPNFATLNGKFEVEELKTRYRVIKKGQRNFANSILNKPRETNAMYNVCHYYFEGVFTQEFDLHHFPFDCQDLIIIFQLMDNTKKAVFLPPNFKDYNAGGLSLQYAATQEYDIHNPLYEYVHNDYGDDESKFSKFNIRLKLERKYFIYIWRIIIFIFVTTVSSLLAFTMDPETTSVSDRYGYLVTLLLTMVAFQFVVSSSLPNIPYLTLMDQYIIFSFLFLFLVLIISAIITFIDEDDISDEAQIDFVCLVSLFGVFVVYHIIFIYQVCKAREFEKKKLKYNIFDYQRLQQLNKDKNQKPAYFGVEFEKHVVWSELVSKAVVAKRFDDLPPPQ